jgi:hypothetical protein
VDADVVHHQNFVVHKPPALHHHFTERNKSCSRTIVLTDAIDGVGDLLWIAAYASNHIVRVTEVAAHRDKKLSLPEMGQRRNCFGTLSKLTRCFSSMKQK